MSNYLPKKKMLHALENRGIDITQLNGVQPSEVRSTEKRCHQVDHIPVWAGDGYFCERCSTPFQIDRERLTATLWPQPRTRPSNANAAKAASPNFWRQTPSNPDIEEILNKVSLRSAKGYTKVGLRNAIETLLAEEKRKAELQGRRQALEDLASDVGLDEVQFAVDRHLDRIKELEKP
jgi:hypothetical protein